MHSGQVIINTSFVSRVESKLSPVSQQADQAQGEEARASDPEGEGKAAAVGTEGPCKLWKAEMSQRMNNMDVFIEMIKIMKLYTSDSQRTGENAMVALGKSEKPVTVCVHSIHRSPEE
ncbi:hypothetical protein TURU_132840 [Turdus rufiventris]|nr:hypothetical protein TURU_132840 [Turdus rufiventris]